MTTRTPEHQAALNASLRARTDARIEDLEFLLGVGTPLDDALDRVGWTLAAASTALRRRNHPLATVVSTAARSAARARIEVTR